MLQLDDRLPIPTTYLLQGDHAFREFVYGWIRAHKPDIAELEIRSYKKLDVYEVADYFVSDGMGFYYEEIGRYLDSLGDDEPFPAPENISACIQVDILKSCFSLDSLTPGGTLVTQLPGRKRFESTWKGAEYAAGTIKQAGIAELLDAYAPTDLRKLVAAFTYGA